MLPISRGLGEGVHLVQIAGAWAQANIFEGRLRGDNWPGVRRSTRTQDFSPRPCQLVLSSVNKNIFYDLYTVSFWGLFNVLFTSLMFEYLKLIP